MFSAKSILPRLIPVALIMMLNLYNVVIGTGRAPSVADVPPAAVKTDTGGGPVGSDEGMAEQYFPRPVQRQRFAMERGQASSADGSTAFAYTVSSSMRPVEVTLEVFDTGGQCVRTLVDSPHEPGQYSYVWRETDTKGQRLADGTYFCKLKAGNYMAARKVVIGG